MHDKIRFYTAKLRNKTEKPVTIKAVFSHSVKRPHTGPSKHINFTDLTNKKES